MNQWYVLPHVVGHDPSARSTGNGPDTRRTTGLQAPRVLKLRTCAQHRLRVVMLHNENVRERWCNGTPCRLLTTQAWTGLAGSIKQNLDKTFAVTRTVRLEEKDRCPEFNVKVIRDEEPTLAKSLRYRDDEICYVPARHDVNFDGFREDSFVQVSLALAAAMTSHKVQGLTVPKVYFCLHKIFGFGIPYTAFTRTPFAVNISVVGVPPRDIYQLLMRRSADGRNLIDVKTAEVAAVIQNDSRIDAIVDERIASGEFSLEKISKRLDKDTAREPQDASDGVHQGLPSRHDLARNHVKAIIKIYYIDWHKRLTAKNAVQAMLAVCARFKKNSAGDGIEPWANAVEDWKTLAEILQGDAANRRRILYFRDVAVGWMEATDVDVLARATDGELAITKRDTDGRILDRRGCPQAPPGFDWQCAAPLRKRKQAAAQKTTAPAGAGKCGQDVPGSGQDPQNDVPPGTAPAPSSMPNPRLTNVALPAARNQVEVKRVKKAALRLTKKSRPASTTAPPQDGTGAATPAQSTVGRTNDKPASSDPEREGQTATDASPAHKRTHNTPPAQPRAPGNGPSDAPPHTDQSPSKRSATASSNRESHTASQATTRSTTDVGPPRPLPPAVPAAAPATPYPNGRNSSTFLNPQLQLQPSFNVATRIGYAVAEADLLYEDATIAALENPGLVCYLNATLHVLARVPKIRQWAVMHLRRHGNAPTCTLCALGQDLHQLATSADPMPFMAATVLTRATWSNGLFNDPARQECAHEAFVTLFEKCDDVDFAALRAAEPAVATAFGGENVHRYSTPSWQACGGKSITTHTCPHCSATVSKLSVWQSLLLAVPGEPTTVEHLLHNRWGDEPLEPSNYVSDVKNDR